MSETKLRVVKHVDFIKTVETVLGHPINKNDVAVVSVNDKPFAERVAAVDLTEMVFKMITFGKGDMKDVAVITQEDLMREDAPNINQNAGIKRKLGK